MKLSYSMILAASVLTLSACSGGGGGGGSAGPGAASAGISTGTYKTSCYSSGGLHYIYQVDVGANSVTFTTLTSQDSACATPGLRTIASYTATFPGAATTPSDAQKVDLTVTSITITPLTDAAVTLLNSGSECNRSNWVKNVTQTVTTDVDCGLGSQTKVYSVVNTTGSNLKIGASDVTNDGLSEAKRHQSYNSLNYVK